MAGTPMFGDSNFAKYTPMGRSSVQPMAGMLGPPMGRPSGAGHGGTSILTPMDGQTVQHGDDLKSMIRSVLQEVGGAPKTLPGKSSMPERASGESISRAELRQMIMDVVGESAGGPSLLADAGETDVSGARGAVAYSREKSRFETHPEGAWLNFRDKARRMLGRHGSQPTNFKNLMTELPFGTMNNRKRMALVLLTAMDELESGNVPCAKGLLAQAMRWIILDLENPRDSLTSWRLTFLPDPVPMVTPARPSGGLDLNNSLLDAAQLTATMGMSRDMELLTKRLKGQKDEDQPYPPKTKKGGGKGKDE